jgi:hypothetical protein
MIEEKEDHLAKEKLKPSPPPLKKTSLRGIITDLNMHLIHLLWLLLSMI